MTPVSINQYAEEIYEFLPGFIRPLCILAGGALRAYYDQTPVKDYDLFFRSEEDFKAALTYLQQHAEGNLKEAEGRTWTWKYKGLVFNLVGFAFCSPLEQIERFDFRCCRIAATYSNTHEVAIYQDPHAHLDALRLELHVLSNNGTERTIERIKRYEDDYGYTLIAPPEDLDEPDVGHPPSVGHLPKPQADEAMRDYHIKVRIRRVPLGGGCGSDGVGA